MCLTDASRFSEINKYWWLASSGWFVMVLYALTRFFLLWDEKDVSPVLLYTITLATIFNIQSSVTRFMWIPPFTSPARKRFALLAHVLSFIFIGWSGILFLISDIPFQRVNGEPSVFDSIRWLLLINIQPPVGILISLLIFAICECCLTSLPIFSPPRQIPPTEAILAFPQAAAQGVVIIVSPSNSPPYDTILIPTPTSLLPPNSALTEALTDVISDNRL